MYGDVDRKLTACMQRMKEFMESADLEALGRVRAADGEYIADGFVQQREQKARAAAERAARRQERAAARAEGRAEDEGAAAAAAAADADAIGGEEGGWEFGDPQGESEDDEGPAAEEQPPA